MVDQNRQATELQCEMPFRLLQCHLSVTHRT